MTLRAHQKESSRPSFGPAPAGRNVSCVGAWYSKPETTGNNSQPFPVIPAGFWRESSHKVIRSLRGPGFPPKACGNDDRIAGANVFGYLCVVALATDQTVSRLLSISMCSAEAVKRSL
jgi:hypothetical protein